ncbi:MULTISPECIES: TonB family protein [Cupriavidus]
MEQQPYDDREAAPRRRWRGPLAGAVAALALALAGWALWKWAGDTASARKEAPRLPPMVSLPPPPPPPPPEQKPPEPVKQERIRTPDPKPMEPAPRPAEAPRPANDAAQSVTMNADAQAGAGGIQVGSGDGMGSGGAGRAGNATYGQYLAYALQRAVQQNPATARLAFPQVMVNMWMDENGRITRVELVRSTGSAATDEALLAALRALGRVDERPPAGLSFPARVVMQARRP